MSRLSHHIAFVALVLWLLSNWAGTHGHYCFDGQEPPMSVHIDVIGDHLEHHTDEIHQDTNADWFQSVIAKLSKIDLGLMLFAAFSLLLVSRPTSPATDYFSPVIPRFFCHWRPPLRAPPTSA